MFWCYIYFTQRNIIAHIFVCLFNLSLYLHQKTFNVKLVQFMNVLVFMKWDCKKLLVVTRRSDVPSFLARWCFPGLILQWADTGLKLWSQLAVRDCPVCYYSRLVSPVNPIELQHLIDWSVSKYTPATQTARIHLRCECAFLTLILLYKLYFDVCMSESLYIETGIVDKFLMHCFLCQKIFNRHDLLPYCSGFKDQFDKK